MMRRLGLLLLVACFLPVFKGFACGDKYVVFGQGVRFQRAYAAAHPAAILVYLSPRSKWSAPENRERLLTVLRMVGHHPEAVTTIDELRAAAGTNKYDLVLTEFADFAQASESVATATRRPSVVPMVFEPSREEMSRIEQENRCAVQVTKRSHELLTTINTVMEQRSKGIIEACQRKRA